MWLCWRVTLHLSEVESSRTQFKVLGLGLEGQVLGLGLEASSPRKLACPRLKDSTIFWNVKILWSAWKTVWKTFFSGDRLKSFCEDLFFFWRALALCVLCPWPWPRAFLSLASRASVLGMAVLGLGLGFFLCPWLWSWPRALCPRLHLCYLLNFLCVDRLVGQAVTHTVMLDWDSNPAGLLTRQIVWSHRCDVVT